MYVLIPYKESCKKRRGSNYRVMELAAENQGLQKSMQQSDGYMILLSFILF